MMTKGSVVVTTVVALIVLLGGAWWLTQDNKPDPTTSSWKEISLTTLGITFKYPEDINQTYTHTTDWPPSLEILDEPFSCSPAGLSNERSGVTTERTIGSRTYCVTEVTEGAAGSIYTQYAYAFPNGDDTTILTFTLRRPQCLNYEPEESTVCQAEQSAFNVDNIVNQIVETIQYN